MWQARKGCTRGNEMHGREATTGWRSGHIAPGGRAAVSSPPHARQRISTRRARWSKITRSCDFSPRSSSAEAATTLTQTRSDLSDWGRRATALQPKEGLLDCLALARRPTWITAPQLFDTSIVGDKGFDLSVIGDTYFSREQHRKLVAASSHDYCGAPNRSIAKRMGRDQKW